MASIEGGEQIVIDGDALVDAINSIRDYNVLLRSIIHTRST